ncbi:Pyridoxal-5'-phosphate-dependent protein beta subunit [Kribbella flavida DSM 17836]|uniref:Pyridoxal-5'-phosphate-dependent protein beta subunit n=1 Tax=Kribbella flavida (strain DSM 17836 / JCM 10339 / NBRC 14399) TaxID=479435 RepID=D2Q3P6_KRIFD|nr:pyridoxal-phosphate dependent enzyme [Kribbella flavida]ADB35918.1 Pyridoxal-5'-phosphate-dependent protein beta subunit [Kribbella flavida DSM 17836]
MPRLLHRSPAARSWRTTPAPTEVLAFHQGLSDYAPTPLHAVPALAGELGVGRVLVKDESHRLGLPAFKALGAWWAIHRALQDHPGTEELVTATDGNHGRAVARRARMLGLRSHVFVPDVVSSTAIDAIRSEGAKVTVLPTSYDAAVVAAASAVTGRQLLIQDSAWPGYEVIPQYIVDGYSTLFREIDVRPDLVVVPMGVGSVAQATVTHYRSTDSAPAVLGVEPARAACITSSLLAGQPVTVETSTTVMAGLNCGTPSSLAWPVLRDGMDVSVTVEEDEAIRAVEDLAAASISSGPSGAATLAGLRAARDALELTCDSTVVLLSTEAN